MPSVGTAYVSIRVNTKGFEAGLDKMLARLSKKMETGGKKLGDDFVKGLSSSNTEKFFRDMELRAQTASTKMSKEFKKVEGSLDNVGLTASDAGDMINSSFGKSGPTLKSLRNDLTDVGRAAKNVERDAGLASRSVNSIGSGGGRGIRSAANDMGFFGNILGSMSKQGVGVRSMLATLHDQFAIMGTAASGLVGGLSSVGQGLFAVGSQAAAAAPALGIFAAGLVGIAQVGGVLAIAMHGVGAAITAGFKSVAPTAGAAAAATKGLGDAVAAASRQVRDARQNLQDAYAAAARAAADAARRTIDAERQLAQSEVALTQAQKDLNAARAEGLQQLKEIGFAAEQASLDEDQAALSLQDAYDQLQATADLAPDDRARVEAELAYKQAELNMREAKNGRQQADKDQKESAKKGLQGTDAMISANQSVHDAQAQVIQDQRDLADARRNEAQTAEDNARRIRDAQQSLADAEKALADARKKGTAATTAATTALDAYNTALKKLSPNQRQFVKDLIKLGPEFKKARNQIADPLFGPLDTAMKNLVGSPFWDQIVTQLTNTSSTLGDLVLKGEEAAKKPPFSTALLSTMKSNNKALTPFAETVGNLANAFIQVADASGPVLNDFAQWTKKVTGAWSQTATMNNKTGTLDATIERAGRRVAVFKDFFVELWHWLKIVGGAATDASEDFKWFDKKGDEKTGYIPMLTEHLKEFNDQLDKGKLKKDFTTALENMSAAGRAVKSAVVDPLLALGRDKRLAGAFDTIGKSDAFERLATNGGEAAQNLADLVVDVADIAATLSESGSFATFIGDLDKVASVISGFLDKVPIGVLKTLGTVLGTLAAIRVTTNLATGLAKALTPPGLDKLPLLPKKIRTAATGAVNAGVALEDAGLKVAAKFELGFSAGMKEVGVQMLRAAKAAMPKTGMVAAGSEFVAGLTVGIEEATPAVVLATKAMATEMVAALKATLGIKSPSTVAMSNGLNFSEAFAAGIAEGAPAAEAAAAEMSIGAAGGLGAGKAAAGAEGAALSAAGAGGVGGAAAGEIGQVGRFAGVFGKFAKFAGPVSKLMKPLSLGIRGIGMAFRFAMGPVGMIILTLLPILWPLLVKLEQKTGIFSKSLKVLTDAFTWLWDKAQPVIKALGEAIGWFWDKVKVTFNWIKDHWDLLLAILTGPIGLAVRFIIKHWGTIVDFVRGLPAKFHRFLDKLWKPVEDRLRDTWNAILRVWSTITDWIKGRPEQFRKNLAALWDIFKTGLQTAFADIKSFWTNNVWPWITGLPGKVTKGLKNIFSGLVNGFISAINWIGGKFQKYLFGPLNSVLDKFGVDKISVNFTPLPAFTGFAEGGPVRGKGGSKSDSILARLSNGEYVMPTAATRKLGHQNLDFMRKTGELPTGGLFGAIVDKARNVVSAVKDGAEFALKWVIGKFADQVEGQNMFGDIAVGLLRNIAGDISRFGKAQDAKAAVTVGGKYTGPPGGWTYPLTKHVVITQYPNAGHNPPWSVDLGAPMGTGVRAATRGTVVSTIGLGNRSYGNYIVLSHAGGVETLYAHLQKFLVKPGQSVKTGQIIALSDDTGGSTGPHLHFEVKPSYSTVDAMRAHGVKLASGGVMAPSAGGTLALLAEAGRSERVTPLDREGFTPAERAMLEKLDASLGGGAGGDTYNVHPAPGMDEAALADKVARRVAWKRRRGTGRR